MKFYSRNETKVLTVTNLYALQTAKCLNDTKFMGNGLGNGYIGLAPLGIGGFDQQDNFLYNLISNNQISKMVFAIFMDFDLDRDNEEPHAKTHIKLGGYDESEKTLKDGEELHFLKTHDAFEWKLNMTNVTMSDKDVPILELKGGQRFITFMPHLPYIYLPEDDFVQVGQLIN